MHRPDDLRLQIKALADAAHHRRRLPPDSEECAAALETELLIAAEIWSPASSDRVTRPGVQRRSPATTTISSSRDVADAAKLARGPLRPR
jgi:hypothetical protein